MKRTISIILVFLLCVMALPLNAFAVEEYTVNYNLTNITVTTAPSIVTSGTAINATITAYEGYELPDVIEVNGLYDDFNYEKSTGNLEITNVQSNIEIIAEGLEIITETYTVAFDQGLHGILLGADEKGQVLISGLKNGANTPDAPEITAELGWLFMGWSPNINERVSKNVIYIAQYFEDDPIVIKYTVNFVDYNGTVLKTEEVESGKGATAPTVTTRDGYTFTGWDKAFDNIVEDTTLNAQYIIETGIGTVILRFEDEDGNELLSEDIITDLELGEYTFNAPIIEGYTADFDSETVTIEYDGDVKYIVFTYTVIENDFTPQLRIVYADCQDIQDEDESLDIFVERSLNEEHNIMEEVYYDLTVGENIVNIPKKYNDLELQFTGKVDLDWDSEIEIETIEENEQEKTIKIYLPYLTSLNYYAGYVKPEEIIIEEPIVEEPVIDKPRKNNNIPKAEEFIPNLKDIKQEDFIARWLEHKPISKELKKFNKEEVKFEISIAEFTELKKEGLEPRVYKWNKEKGKLIAEATVIEKGIEVVTIKHPTVLENNLNEYYAVFAVKQPKFEDVNEKDSNFRIIDKANGLGIIEGIEKDEKIYFDADKEISKSEYYIMVARIFGAMPEGEMKMYNILDFKSIAEADEILEGIELGLDDWAKPYISSLLEQGYIVSSDLKDNQFNFSRDFNLVEKLFSVAEKKKNTFNFVEGKTREAVVENLIKMLEI